jgi:hypothetical protein
MCNFSQIYPMDRGTNYAVRDGLRMAKLISESLASHRHEPAASETKSEVRTRQPTPA